MNLLTGRATDTPTAGPATPVMNRSTNTADKVQNA